MSKLLPLTTELARNQDGHRFRTMSTLANPEWGGREGRMLAAVGTLSSWDSPLYFICAWINFTPLHADGDTSVWITRQKVTGHKRNCEWVSEALPRYFPLPYTDFLSPPLVLKVWGVVVVVGSCGDPNTGTSASHASYRVFPSLNFVNECWMKNLRSASCWK